MKKPNDPVHEFEAGYLLAFPIEGNLPHPLIERGADGEYLRESVREKWAAFKAGWELALTRTPSEDLVRLALKRELEPHKITRIIREFSDYAATPGEIEAAISTYAHGSDDNIEIDDDAITSRVDIGTWVSAWVWLEKRDMPGLDTSRYDPEP